MYKQSMILPMETTSIPKKKLHAILEQILSEKQLVQITVTGSSMQPFFRHARDRVCLSQCNPDEIKRGDILLYTRDDGAWVLHRVYRVSNGSFTMIGDGQWVLEPNVEPRQVLARAIFAIRDGKRISCERGVRHAAMKLYLYRMCAPRFFRAVVDAKESLKSIVKKVVRPAARQ